MKESQYKLLNIEEDDLKYQYQSPCLCPYPSLSLFPLLSLSVYHHYGLSYSTPLHAAHCSNLWLRDYFAVPNSLSMRRYRFRAPPPYYYFNYFVVLLIFVRQFQQQRQHVLRTPCQQPPLRYGSAANIGGLSSVPC